MSPELYFAVMLITNPQKARRILLAEELENWFMDLFDEEYEDILDGTFRANQEIYVDRIIDKYLEITGVSMTATDEYSKSVVDKAVKSAVEIQDTTWRNIVAIKGSDAQEDSIAEFIKGGIAIGTTLFATDVIKRWLSQDRANLIALNEANWKWNNEEYFDAQENNKTKIWHTALDERVRLTHISLEGVELPINEPFHVGSSLMQFPCDPNGAMSEIANCRCTLEYKR